MQLKALSRLDRDALGSGMGKGSKISLPVGCTGVMVLVGIEVGWVWVVLMPMYLRRGVFGFWGKSGKVKAQSSQAFSWVMWPQVDRSFLLRDCQGWFWIVRRRIRALELGKEEHFQFVVGELVGGSRALGGHSQLMYGKRPSLYSQTILLYRI